MTKIKLADAKEAVCEIAGFFFAIMMLMLMLGVCGIAMGSGDILTELIRSIF